MKKLEELGISNFPWKTIYRSHYPYPAFCRVAKPDGYWVVEVSGEDDEMLKANARLIAAAPELYEALLLFLEKGCVRCYSAEYALTGSVPCAEGCEVYKKAKYALLKAAGEEAK